MPIQNRSYQGPLVGLVLGVLLMTGCAKDAPPAPPPPPPPPLAEVLPTIPLPPGAVPLTQESGEDVTQLLFVTPLAPDSLVSFYRTTLDQAQYRLLSEQQVEGSTVFVAEQSGRGLWITVRSDSAGGSSVSIAGGMAGASAKAATGTP